MCQFAEIIDLHSGNIHVIFWTCSYSIKCPRALRWQELDILSENVVKVRVYYMFQMYPGYSPIGYNQISIQNY